MTSSISSVVNGWGGIAPSPTPEPFSMIVRSSASLR
jgi:hypothetical protein